MTKEAENINFTIDPGKTPILSADAYLISSNSHTLTLNFAQASLDGQQQNIVARVSLTPGQIKEFAANLADHIEKFEI